MILNEVLLTEKGNLKAPVAHAFKEQAAAILMEALGLEETVNGTFAKTIGTGIGEDGKTFYLTATLTVGSANPFAEVVKKEKAKADAPVLDIPSIFAAE